MTFIPDAVLESATSWLQIPKGDMFFTHVPSGRRVVIVTGGDEFYFEMHPQLKLKTSDIPQYLSEGRIRVRADE